MRVFKRFVSIFTGSLLTRFSFSTLVSTDNVHMQQSMLLMKVLARNGILYHSQIYPDENHALPTVARHLYRSMEAFLNECFDLESNYDDVGLRRRRVSKGHQ